MWVAEGHPRQPLLPQKGQRRSSWLQCPLFLHLQGLPLLTVFLRGLDGQLAVQLGLGIPCGSP